MLTAADGSDTTATSLPFTVSAGQTAVATLPPTTVSSTVPTAVVAGGKVKGTVTITVTDSTAAPLKGAATFNLFASRDGFIDGAATLVATLPKKVNLKAGQALKIKLNVKSLPASLIDGTYTLLSQSIAPGGIVNNATSGPIVQIAASFVAAGSVVGPISPAAIKPGKSGNIAITLTNTGNVPITGANFDIGFTTDNFNESTRLISTHKSFRIKVGDSKTIKARFVIPAGQAAGTYTSYVNILLVGAIVSTTSIGPGSFIVV